ncbi:MAG: EamA family transporter [Thermoanaerobaculales bacterium]|jgi:drug/metabolite transporter (DMT)-like permease|nr:EamA family transporter [Thermoanaerobaculales bacterium]
MTTSSPGADRLLILITAILFSTGGAAVKATTLTAWQVAGFRAAVAALAILVLVPEARRGWSRATFAVGSAFAATTILFVFANKLTTAANAIFLQGTAPLYVVLLSPLMLGEKIRRRQLVTMAVIAVGMVFFFVGRQPVSVIAADPVTGNLLAAASGLSYALLIIGLRRLGSGPRDSGTTMTAVCCGNLIAAAVAMPMALPVASATTTDWTAVLYLGLFQIGLAYVLLVRGIARVPALEASLILIIEPVLSPFWAWLVHGEAPTAWSVLGGVVILSATAVMTLTNEKRA